MTYGEKAVGLTFNPSGDKNVERVKKLYAEIIDMLEGMRHGGSGEAPTIASPERYRLLSVAITEAQTAQMWAVKAITWRDE